MNDHMAQARAVVEEIADLASFETEKVRAIIAAALSAVEQRVWEEAAKQADRGVYVWEGMNNGKAAALAEFRDYCRTQAQQAQGREVGE